MRIIPPILALWLGCLLTLSAAFAAQQPSSRVLASSSTDSKTTADQPLPQRVVVLDWDLLEQLLTLDIIPVGATEIASYNQWVVQPAAPEVIQEVGTRAEPNLEKIAALKPDIILASASQQDLLPILERIAPVLYLPNFAQQDDAGPVAIAHFQTLAQRLGKSALAEQKITELNQHFAQLNAQLQHAFPVMPEVAVMRFSNLSTVFLYNQNSTTQYVLDRLGLTTALPLPPQPWGTEQRRMNQLQYITDGYVLYILPFPDEAKLQHSVLWQAMPFVRQGRMHSVPPVWNYGGITSLQRMAEAITQSLLAVAPASTQNN